LSFTGKRKPRPSSRKTSRERGSAASPFRSGERPTKSDGRAGAGKEAAGAATAGYGFGTFKGVFTPSILTILGVIMYLRLGWVLGNTGLAGTLVIVTMASAITFLTGISLAALATNMRGGGGGAYYIISRSLGLEPGAAVGIPLYLAQALGIAFYVSGFTEALTSVLPSLPFRLVGVVTLVLLAAVAWLSANLALRVQYVVLTVITLSLVSFFSGGSPPAPPPPAAGTLPTLGFWAVFAVFFPAVTGIEAGIAMSGDLKNPGRSLPLGTIGAISLGYLVYLAIPVFMTFTVSDRGLLISEPMIMARIARWGDLVVYGVWAASLSSAMGALLGAPRTLQALARDGVLPRFIGRGSGKGKDPRVATAISFLIALAGILLGGINVIAPVLSMFFLTSYGLLNLSAGLEELISAPAWRPRFRIPAAVSLTGFFGCFATMFMINAGATFLAAMVSGLVYYFMKKRSLHARWGDIRFAALMFGAREIFYRLAGLKHDERTWKPNILVLSGSPAGRWYLIELADAISQGRSFVTVTILIPEASWTADRAESITASVREYLRKRDVRAFVKTFASDEPLAGAQQIIRTYGFGPVVPNTILIGETEKAENFMEFARLVKMVHRSRRNLIVMRERRREDPDGEPPESERRQAEPEETEHERIDVWWKGKSHNIAFILALVMLLRRSPLWEKAVLNIRLVVEDEEERVEYEKALQAFVEKERLRASTETIIRKGRDVYDIIRTYSEGADMVFLGLRPPAEDEGAGAYSNYYQALLEETRDLPPTALLMAAEQIDFRRIFESGPEPL
jgi:amino acid transporter